MNCPYCGADNPVPQVVQRNMEAYGNACHIAAQCCGKPLITYPKFSYTISTFKPSEKTDDWGHAYTPV